LPGSEAFHPPLTSKPARDTPGARPTDKNTPATRTLAPATHFQFQTEDGDSGCRLDIAIARRLPALSRSRIGRLATEGWILVDGRARKPAFRLHAGQRIHVAVPPAAPAGLTAEAIPLDVVYEDADLLVVNKPAGLTVHPAPGHPSGTLVNAVLARVPDLPGIGGTLRPGIVHRLDKDTSGLLVVAKTDEAHRSLAAQLRTHSVVRMYLAVVRGRLRRDAGVIAAPIGRHPAHRTRLAVVPRGREAVTHYEVLERFRTATLLACRLETGRTHQIRVHLTHIGHPILGDPVYGRAPAPEMRRQALHAARLEFTHPRTGRRITCTAPIPEDMGTLLARLRHEEGGRGDAASPRSASGEHEG
jgi:23S rRNA pseudouridine1911/1915/1917 synthase